MTWFLGIAGVAVVILALASWHELAAALLGSRPTVGPARCDSCGEVLDDGTGRLHPSDCVRADR